MEIPGRRKRKRKEARKKPIFINRAPSQKERDGKKGGGGRRETGRKTLPSLPLPFLHLFWRCESRRMERKTVGLGMCALLDMIGAKKIVFFSENGRGLIFLLIASRHADIR